MRNISAAIAATIALATTALAVEIANHRTGSTPPRTTSSAPTATPTPAPSDDKNDLEVMEIWTQNPRTSQARADDAKSADEIALDAPAPPRTDAPKANASGAKASAAVDEPPSPRILDKASDATDAKTKDAKSEGPVREEGKPALEAPIVTYPTRDAAAAKPSALEKPRHAHRATPHRYSYREAKWGGPESHVASSHRAKSSHEGAFWRTRSNSYGFSGSFGGCLFRGSVSAAGYHVDRSC